ncbi:MAG: diguanylate cyclase [Candidatus Electrothrix aestuarii]|uniref:diguanylate cyclase n=1 Tax=Candidatus Electrothrix aestuarii TaxID=3062594 RepID=A0AAU8LVP3_9BACT|nr:diguanylate cyclase [Candidatus Electrothrix aestuarii]
MLKIGLRNRFLLYFLPLLLVILVQGGWNVRTFANVHRHFNALQKEETRNASAMLDLKKLLLSLETGIREQKFDQEVIREKANQLSSMIKQHAQHKHNGMTPEEEAAHEMLHHAIFATTLSQYLLEQSEKGWPSKKEELEQISEAIREERGHLENAIDEHLRLHIRQIDRTEAFISQQYHHTLTVVVLTGFAVIALTLFVVFLMMRCVLGPMKILQEGTRQIGMGNLDHQVQINSGDEFEFLAQEFGKMAEQLASYHNEFDLKVKQRTSELLRANAELKELSGLVHIDGLTRVANRRYFDMRLCQEWKQLACERSSLAVIFVDLDYFKQYNDTYGHQAGDECLQKIAHMLQHNLRRPTDLAARYGGEEFILLLPRTDEAGAQQVAKNVQQALRELRIPHERSAVGAYVTCSMGIAITIPTVDSSVDVLVAAADDALYQAKAWGRNQYVISEKLNSSAQQEVS